MDSEMTASELAEYEAIWEQRSLELEAAAALEDQTARVIMVLFQMGREVYAVEAQHVSEVRPLDEVVRLPRQPEWLLGVMNLRGRICTVIDLRRFFGLPKYESGTLRPGLVLVRAAGHEAALLVDRVLVVSSMPENWSEEVHSDTRLPGEYLRGAANYCVRSASGEERGLAIILDLPSLLSDRRLLINDEMK